MSDRPYRLIIAGSRELTIIVSRVHTHVDRFVRREAITDRELEIVSGGARGADASGERYSESMLHKRPKIFPADWDAHGKGAGHIRNEKMALYADGALIFFKRRPSPGSSDMLAWMMLLGKPVDPVLL